VIPFFFFIIFLLVGFKLQDYMPNFSFLCCLEVIDLWLESKKKRQHKISIKLMAPLARAEVKAGFVAKADQQCLSLEAFVRFLNRGMFSMDTITEILP
jgi:hypothetical protein